MVTLQILVLSFQVRVLVGQREGGCFGSRLFYKDNGIFFTFNPYDVGMKKGILMWLAFATAVGLSAGKLPEPVKIKLDNKPVMVFTEDSVRVTFRFYVPGGAIGRQTHHRLHLRLIDPSDTTMYRELSRLSLEGNARSRYLRRERRRQGMDPKPFQWRRSYKSHRKKTASIVILVKTPLEDWMRGEGVRIRADQFRSARLGDPFTVLEPEYLTPLVSCREDGRDLKKH